MANLALTVTDVGNAKFADAINSGVSIDINRLALGSSAVPHSAASTQLHALIRSFAIESITKSGQTVTFSLTIPESWGGYNLREVGLLSVTGDLMAVGNMDLYKPNAAGGLGFAVEFQVNLILADVDVVSDVVAGVVQGANADLAVIEAARDDALSARTAAEAARDDAMQSFRRPLGVADPRIAPGVPADIGDEGWTSETPPRFFKKVAALDTSWEQVFVSAGGVFRASIQLAQAAGQVLPANTLGLVGRELRLGDDSTLEGNPVFPAIANTYYVDPVFGDDANGGGLTPYRTHKAAMEAAVADNPDSALIVTRPGDYPYTTGGNPNHYVPTAPCSTKFYFWFDLNVALLVDTFGTFLDNQAGHLDVRFMGGFVPGAFSLSFYRGPASPDPLAPTVIDFHPGQGIGGPNGGFFIQGGHLEMTNYSYRASASSSISLIGLESGVKATFKNVFCKVDSLANPQGTPPAFVSIDDSSEVSITGGYFHNFKAATYLGTGGKLILRDCLHTYNGSGTGDRPALTGGIIAHTIHFVGSNFSSGPLASTCTADTTFGTFTQADPSVLFV